MEPTKQDEEIRGIKDENIKARLKEAKVDFSLCKPEDLHRAVEALNNFISSNKSIFANYTPFLTALIRLNGTDRTPANDLADAIWQTTFGRPFLPPTTRINEKSAPTTAPVARKVAAKSSPQTPPQPTRPIEPPPPPISEEEKKKELRKTRVILLIYKMKPLKQD